MAIKSEYIFFGVLAIIVLYAISKLRNPEVQRVPEFIGGAVAPTSDSAAANAAAKVGAFNAVAQLGAAQIAAETTRDQTAAQLEATRIASQVQQGEQATQTTLQRIISDAQERVQALVTGAQERIQSQTISAQLTGQQANLDAQSYLYNLDLQNRLQQMQLQIGAVNNAAVTYRNQSLERLGTIFNALGQIWGGGSPYSYQQSFGGPRGPSVLQQLFPQGIGSTIAGFFGF